MTSAPLIVAAAFVAMQASLTVGLKSRAGTSQPFLEFPVAQFGQQAQRQQQKELAWPENVAALSWQEESPKLLDAQSSQPLQEDLQIPEQPQSAVSGEQFANPQMSYSESVPAFMRQHDQFLGCSGHNPGFFRRSVRSPVSMQESSSEGHVIMQPSLQRTVMALQAQLATERSTELQLANVAASRQQEMLRVNASFARILSLAEKGADQERQLQAQLVKATASNEALQAQLSKVRNEEMQKTKELVTKQAEVAKLQDSVNGAEERASQSDLMQKRTLHDSLRVMKDVQTAQLKVQRAEEMIRKLLPRLQPSGLAASFPQPRV